MANKKPLNSIKIRKMLVKDLPQVVKIQEAITKAKVPPNKIAILRKHIQKPDNISIVALSEGKVLGYVISEIMTNSFGLYQGGWIENVGVDPMYMGEGLGQALAHHLFEAYQKRKICEIYTAALWDSVDLLSFFKSVGFDRSNFINLCKKLD